MMPAHVTLNILKCKQCPHHEVGAHYSLDGFDRGADWKCGMNGRSLAQFVERPSEADSITPPSWCPLRGKRAVK